MNHVKVLAHAIALTAIDRASDLFSCFMLPKATRAVQARVPKPTSRWATAPLWTRKTIDGGILEGEGANTGAKYAIPKGLPQEGDRVLAIEGPVHEVDGFNGVIHAGYGKGTKTLLADESVVVKVADKSSIARMNYHVHDADVAGLHYDLSVAGVPAGKDFEINIPRGPYKGRFAFIHTRNDVIVTPMKDRGVILPKPDYKLKTVDWLRQIDPSQYIFERKLDGSLANVSISESGRAAFRSHRDGPNTGTYYDKLPGLEFLFNHSPFLTLRQLDPGPQLGGTVLKVELVHPDGVSRTAGILNAHPEKAQLAQAKRGNVEAFAWDIVTFKGKDVSQLPYIERRALLERVIRTIRLYNPNWHVVERYDGAAPEEFYHRVTHDPRGLPFAEGIVVKPAGTAAESWYKIKARDFVDLVVVSIDSGNPGTKYSDSLGRMVVEDPRSGGRGEIGSFAVSSIEREWIWLHRSDLIGAVAKVSVTEFTESGAPRAGIFHGWHPDPRYGGIGSEQALAMYAETTAGLDPEEGKRAMYAMKTAAGWRKA